MTAFSFSVSFYAVVRWRLRARAARCDKGGLALTLDLEELSFRNLVKFYEVELTRIEGGARAQSILFSFS